MFPGQAMSLEQTMELPSKVQQRTFPNVSWGHQLFSKPHPTSNRATPTRERLWEAGKGSPLETGMVESWKLGLNDEIPCSSWGRAAFLLQLFLPAAGMCPRMGFQDSSAQNEVPNTSVPAFPKAGALTSPHAGRLGWGIGNSSSCLIWGRNSTLSLVGWWNSLVASRGGTAGQDTRQDKGKWAPNVPGEEIGHWRRGQALGQTLQGNGGEISLQVFKKRVDVALHGKVWGDGVGDPGGLSQPQFFMVPWFLGSWGVYRSPGKQASVC